MSIVKHVLADDGKTDENKADETVEHERDNSIEDKREKELKTETESKDTDKVETKKAGTENLTIYVTVGFGVLVAVIIVTNIYSYRHKNAQSQLDSNERHLLYRSSFMNNTYDNPGSVATMECHIDRIVNLSKDIKSQVRLLPYDWKREISRTSFKILEEIGSGNFGFVCKGELYGLYGPNSTTEVAIKSVNGSFDGSHLMDLLQEIKIMGHIKPHINLVSMIGSCRSDLETTGDLWLLLEFCHHGDLKSYLTKNEKQILGGSEEDAINSRCLIKWAYDISKGMEYLSAKKIMHGDLAARNILLDHNPVENAYPVARVADYGLSKRFYDNVCYAKEERLYVPWKWLAYEFLTKNIFTLASDVWSYAVVVWEILSFGRIPYGHQEYMDVVKQVEGGYRLPCPTDIDKITSWSPQMLYEELSKVCFLAEPDDRASFEDVTSIIEKQLTEDEISEYREMEDKYQNNRANNYLRIGQN